MTDEQKTFVDPDDDVVDDVEEVEPEEVDVDEDEDDVEDTLEPDIADD